MVAGIVDKVSSPDSPLTLEEEKAATAIQMNLITARIYRNSTSRNNLTRRTENEIFVDIYNIGGFSYLNMNSWPSL